MTAVNIERSPVRMRLITEILRNFSENVAATCLENKANKKRTKRYTYTSNKITKISKLVKHEITKYLSWGNIKSPKSDWKGLNQKWHSQNCISTFASILVILITGT